MHGNGCDNVLHPYCSQKCVRPIKTRNCVFIHSNAWVDLWKNEGSFGSPDLGHSGGILHFPTFQWKFADWLGQGDYCLCHPLSGLRLKRISGAQVGVALHRIHLCCWFVFHVIINFCFRYFPCSRVELRGTREWRVTSKRIEFEAPFRS